MRLKKHTAPEIRDVKRTLRAMGTTVTIAIYGEEFVLANEAISRAFEVIVEIEKEMNHRTPQSELYRLNEKASLKEVAVSPALFGVPRRSVQLSRLTKGPSM
jgi:thiamine biosynthesis lipoprotein ApbE